MTHEARVLDAPRTRTGGVTLREAYPAEYERVGDLLEEAFTTGCWVTELYRERLHSIRERAETAHVWVAVTDGQLLGAVLTPRVEHYRDDRFTFNILGVGRAGRGRGIGAMLVNHAIDCARDAGYGEIEIHSSPQMTAAHALYYRLGFVRRIDWETAVVDGGQRLFDFTLRLPSHPAPSSSQNDPQLTRKEAAVPLTNLRPAGGTDSAGLFHPDPFRRRGPFGLAFSDGAVFEISLSASDPRGWAALLARRLTGLEGVLSVRYLAPGNSPQIVDGAGSLVSDDWRYFSRAIIEAARQKRRIGTHGDLYPDGLRGEVDAFDKVIQQDLIVGLDQALFSESARAREAAGRVFFARLGALDLHLSAHRYLAGDQLTSADLTLAGVLFGYDVGPRSHLGWGAPVLADYPDLWGYARELYQIPRLVNDDDKRELGILLDSDGATLSPWGPAAPSETIADFAAAWEEPHGRASAG